MSLVNRNLQYKAVGNDSKAAVGSGNSEFHCHQALMLTFYVRELHSTEVAFLLLTHQPKVRILTLPKFLNRNLKLSAPWKKYIDLKNEELLMKHPNFLSFSSLLNFLWWVFQPLILGLARYKP